MDRIRTLLLEGMHTVVLDPDRVANAGTRPTRDVDVDRFEADLAQLGFVMSLDLAMTLRRLPNQTIEEARRWILDTLGTQHGGEVPRVQAGDTARYLPRILTWLRTRAEQPCPWCGQLKVVGALDPCGHLVCRTCWSGGNFGGCPICHRRTAVEPFVTPGAGPRIEDRDGTLKLLHLAIDPIGTVRERFERLLARAVRLSPRDRAELELVIDAIGPKVVTWLPASIPVKETAAIAVARMWLVAADRTAMIKATAADITTATDVLRVAAVLMGGTPDLVEPMHLRSISRGLRRAILGALDALPIEEVAVDVMRHEALWKRIGERLHPFEDAGRHVRAALAFAIVRGTDLDAVSFGPLLRTEAAKLSCVRAVGSRLRPISWSAPVEDALRARNPRAALGRLMHRPGDLLRRADHLIRIAQLHQLDGLETVLKGIKIASARGSGGTLLILAAHLARRGVRWPRRVLVPDDDVLRAWTMPERRSLLRADVIGALVGALRSELTKRAEARRHFPRAVIDRALLDVPFAGSRRAVQLVRPHGSELTMPDTQTLRVFAARDEAGERRAPELAVELFDHEWRHVATCDAAHPVLGGERRAATHAACDGALVRGERVDLDVEALRMLGARHAVMAVGGAARAFVGVASAPDAGSVFDPSPAERIELRGRPMIAIPLAIDLADHRILWLGVRVRDPDELAHVGGYRAALAHAGRDVADFIGTQARATMWELACIHAAGRANLVYVRERDGSFTTYRRRDREPTAIRLARLLSGSNDDGKHAAMPTADAPTWFALTSTTGIALPAGSSGYALDGGKSTTAVKRWTGRELAAELVPTARLGP